MSLGFTRRRHLPHISPRTLINPRGLGYLTSPRIEVRDNDTKYKSSIEITTQYSHVLDEHNFCEANPQPAAREDYSLIITRSMKENIVELLKSIPNILTRSPIARRSQLQAMAMTMRWDGDGDDELWWW